MNRKTGRLSSAQPSPSSSGRPVPGSARRVFIGRVLGGLAVAVPAVRVLTDTTPASAESDNVITASRTPARGQVPTPETSTIAAGYTLVVAAENATTKVPVNAGASAAAGATITYGPSTGSENTVVSAAPIVAKGSALYSLLVPINWKVIVTVTGTGASIASSKVQPA